MNDYQVVGESITKSFGRRLVFKDVNFSFPEPGIYGIAGCNGSGKSTLVKIIAGIISPTQGKVKHSFSEKNILPEDLHKYTGFVAPYLILYDEFSAEENLRYFAEIRGIVFNKEKIDALFKRFSLYERRHDLVKGYSSGMKQRLKYIFAFMHSPKIILLDEPVSNLDSSGKEVVYKIIKEVSVTKIVVIASNEESDLAYCKDIIYVENFRNKG
jgi:ABC-type multidrug transport system ATPase subunit